MTTSIHTLIKRIGDRELQEELTRVLERHGTAVVDPDVGRLYVPHIGDHIQLTEPWTFTAYPEERNVSLFKALKVIPEDTNGWHWSNSMRDRSNRPRQWKMVEPVTLPAGTILTVDRVYIRQNNDEFASVTFRTSLPDYKKRIRFWAKLDDINTIVFKPSKEPAKNVRIRKRESSKANNPKGDMT